MYWVCADRKGVWCAWRVSWFLRKSAEVFGCFSRQRDSRSGCLGEKSRPETGDPRWGFEHPRRGIGRKNPRRARRATTGNTVAAKRKNAYGSDPHKNNNHLFCLKRYILFPSLSPCVCEKYMFKGRRLGSKVVKVRAAKPPGVKRRVYSWRSFCTQHSIESFYRTIDISDLFQFEHIYGLRLVFYICAICTSFGLFNSCAHERRSSAWQESGCRARLKPLAASKSSP